MISRANRSSGRHRSATVVHEQPWGLQALVQLVAFCVIGVLLARAVEQQANPAHTPPEGRAWLLRVSDFVENDLLVRLDRALKPELGFQNAELGKSGVANWALVSLLGNFVSALMLILATATRWRRDRPGVRVLVGFLAFAAIAMSLLAVPFLFGALTTAAGKALPIDAAMASIIIYTVYLLLDVVLLRDSEDHDERQRHITLLAAVDLPCFVATLIFICCNLTVPFPPTFSVGVSAALLLYYCLAFQFLNTIYWFRSAFGGATMNKKRSHLFVAIAIGAAINCLLGFLVQLLKLPIYLDLVGSIFVALLYGPRAGIFAAILGSVSVGLATTPITIAYIGTAVGVTWAAYQLKRYGYGTKLWPTFLLGLFVLGPLSTVLSVPITTYLFSGVTFTGSDIITAVFMNKMGTSLIASVAAGAFLFDAIDKGLASVMSMWLYRATPDRLLETAAASK